eukprot:g4838.t1
MATEPPENGAVRSACAEARQSPPSPPQPESNTPWRRYLDRLAGLCGAEADSPPTADLLRPPTDLLAHPQQHPQKQEGEPGSTTTDGVSADVGSGSGSGPSKPADGGSAAAGAGAAAGVDAPSNTNLVLVLLDMNGTLLYRAKKPLRAASGGGPEAAAAAAATVEAGVAFVHGHPDPFQYYMRPGAAELVAAMHRHPRVRLAFYTSMRGVNALPAARFLMPDDGTHGATPEVYDRRFNARDPHGAKPWDTTRDLPLIWSTPGRAGEGFGPANTVMVDDTPRKMRFMEAGLVVVPEFKAACVLESLGLRADTGGGTEESEEAGEDAARRQGEVLPRLLEYLGRLLEESGADVRPFIENNPFRPREPFSSFSSAGVEPENGCSGSSAPAAAAAGATAARFSIVQAVELVLTTGPLARSRLNNGEDASSPAAGATAVGMLGEGPEERAVSAPGGGGGGGGGGGRSTFEGFGQNLGASVVEAVCELLAGVNAAAERWGLSPQERGLLQAWSRAAEAGSGGEITASAC